jgi:hypothetical protein
MFSLYSTRALGNISSGDPSTPASWLGSRCDCPGECFLDSLWDEGDPFPQLTDKIESLTNADIQTDSAGVAYIQCTGDWEIVIKDRWRNWWPFTGIYPGGFYIKINRSSGLTYMKASTHYNENVGTNLIATLTHTWYSLEKPASHSSGGLLCQGILREWYPNAPQYGVSGISNYEAVGLTVFHHDEIPTIPAPTPPYYSYWSSVIVEKNSAPQTITDTPSGDSAIRGYPFQASCCLRQVSDWSLPKRIWGNGSVKIYDIRRVAQRSLLEGGDYTIAWLVSGTQRTPTSSIKIIFEYNPANNIPGSSDRLPPGVFLFRLKHKVYDSQNGTWGTVHISDEAALVFANSLWSSSNISSFLSSHSITPDSLEYETQQREAYCRPRGCLIFVSKAPNDNWFRTATDINGDRSAFNTMQESDSLWYQASPEARGAEITKLYREIRAHAYCDADGPDQFSVYTYCTGSTNWTVNVIATKQTDGYQFSYSGTPLVTVRFGEYFVLGLTELPWGMAAWWQHGRGPSSFSSFSGRNVLYTQPLYKTDYITYLEAATFGYWGTAPSGSFVSAAYLPQEYAQDEAGFLKLFVSKKSANNPLVLAPCMDWPYSGGAVQCPCPTWPTYLIADIGLSFQIQAMMVSLDGSTCKFGYGAITSIYKNWSTVATLTNSDVVEWRAPAINLVSSTGCGYGVQWPIAAGEIQETFNSAIPVALRITPRFYINHNCELVGELIICYTGCPLVRDESVNCIDYQLLQDSRPSDFAVSILVPGDVYRVDTAPESGFSLICHSETEKFEAFSETTTETTSAEGNQRTSWRGTHRGMVSLAATLGPVLSECDFLQAIGQTNYTQTFAGSASFKLVKTQSELR